MTLITKPDMEFIWASGGAVVQPSDVKVQTGWTPEVPPHQWENWVQNRQDQYIAHVNQRGIPAWDGNTEYEAGGLSYTQGSDGIVYKSVAASGPATTVQDPTTDVADTYWTIAFASVGAFLSEVTADTLYLRQDQNGSDVDNASTFRANIGIVASSLTAAGLIELATSAEVLTGTDAVRAVAPSTLATNYSQKPSIFVTEEQSTGVSPGNNINGLNIRQLNTVRTNTIVGASLAAGQVTLPAGSYKIYGSSPFFNGDQHRCYLYNVTDASIVSLGTSENAGAAFTTRSLVKGKLTIASSKVFELRHWMPVAQTRGLGDPVNDTQVEVYAELELIREGI